MIDEYEVVLGRIEESLAEVGFSRETDSDFVAALGGSINWKILFEGDRFTRPAFDLILKRDKSYFSIWILMKVFNDQSIPSLENQLSFLKRRFDDLAVEGDIPYALAYDKLNSIQF